MAVDNGNFDSPASFAAAVTPNDSTDLTTWPRALFVAGAGDIAVLMAGDGAAVTFTGVPAGTILPVRVKRVKSTGTTATGIVGVW